LSFNRKRLFLLILKAIRVYKLLDRKRLFPKHLNTLSLYIYYKKEKKSMVKKKVKGKKLKVTPEEAKELLEIFCADKGGEPKDMKISYDRGQYKVIIPKRFIEAITPDLRKNVFRFRLFIDDKGDKKIEGELIQNEKN